jgi:hypothetical protein
MPFAEDFDLWTRMIERHDAHNIGEPLIDYRQSSGSIMSAIGRDDRAGVELRHSHAAIITRRLESELRRTCEPAEANLLSGVVAGLAPSEIARFLSSYDAITEAFEQRLAEATATPDYWRTRARQLDAVAHRLNPPSRLGAARVYLHSLRRNPGLATHVSWPRLAAATVLGRRGRDRARAAIEAVH